ncbi:class I SAM-dependent methyltransferase [Catellatospora bangladeshensis]|uniref:class I SAM-dependent methyltransferase n=1 Tax=Catellatospora bangladeshensis TaxID=310355 RepID=UPI0019426E11|nr:class I SAM-dependent methyltransferase [Catellatospora bangladeshensis]
MGVSLSVQATAYAAAACRAAETRSARPRLVDPLAALFTPDGVAAPVASLADAGREEVVGRTVLIDTMLVETLARRPGAAVVNLGAGYCTRPYRLELPCREVVEADDPALLALKEQVLRGQTPRCPVRRVGLDVRDPTALTALLASAGDGGAVVVVTEGLLVYLASEQVRTLAGVLAGVSGVVGWLADIVGADSARQMAAVAQRVPGGLALHGLDSLDPLERPGWRVAAYRALPVARPRYGPGPAAASRTVVDGVLSLEKAEP